MSKVISLAGAQSAANVKIQQQAGILEFHFRTPDAQAADWATLKTRMNAVFVTVDIQSKTGRSETLVPKIALGTLAEIFSSADSFIYVMDNGTDHDVQFSVELSQFGALALDAETSIVVDIAGMVANDYLDVYAVDFHVASRAGLKANTIRFAANAAQVIGLGNGGILHLPKASFEKVELSYPNGKTLTLLKKEAERWCLEGNGIAGTLNGVCVMGFIDWYSLNVQDAMSAKVTLTADANGYLFSQITL